MQLREKIFLKFLEVIVVAFPSSHLYGRYLFVDGSQLNPKTVCSPSKVILLQQTQAFMNIHSYVECCIWWRSVFMQFSLVGLLNMYKDCQRASLLELGCHVYSFNLMTFVVAINFFANMFCVFGQLLFSQLNDRRVSQRWITSISAFWKLYEVWV